MRGRLLERLKQRQRALTFLEWREAQLHESRPAEFTLQDHGHYLLAESPSPEHLWSVFAQALSSRRPLVVIGPMSAETKAIYLRQLPATPPAGALLALFTSGSTGQAKAVFHSEASLLASGEQLATGLGAPVSQCSLLPAWAMAGIAFHFLMPLFSGKRLLWWKQPTAQSAHELPGALLAAKTELLALNPFLLEMVMRNESFGTKQLDVVSLTAPLTAAHRERFRATCPGFLREIYGMTEAAGPILLDGRSLGARTKRAEDGELFATGAQFFLGYGAEGEFAPREEWFATGDIFQWEQEYKFVSRKKDLIDIGGRKIPPALIEEIFLSLPEIAECLAFPVKVQGVERVGLVFARKAECRITAEELSTKISERSRTSLSLDMRPFWWRELDQLPRLPNGKVSRAKVRDLFGGERQGGTSPS